MSGARPLSGNTLLLFLAWRLAGPIARALPLRLAYALSGLLMDLAWLCWPRGRRAMRANLRVLLATNDTAQIDYWSQRQLRRYGELLVDTARLSTLEAATAPDLLISEQWPELDAVMHGPRPVIFALAHFGNWDVAGAALSGWSQQHGAPSLHVLAESLGNAALDDVMRRERDRLGLISIAIEASLLPAMRALRSGAPLAILFDRPLHPDEPGVDVTLAAGLVRLPAGLARLALASNAKVVPIAMARLPGRNFHFHPLVDFDLEYQQTGDREEDCRRLMQDLVDVHANWFRQHPDQWYQFRSFFAAIHPPGTPIQRDTRRTETQPSVRPTQPDPIETPIEVDAAG